MRQYITRQTTALLQAPDGGKKKAANKPVSAKVQCLKYCYSWNITLACHLVQTKTLDSWPDLDLPAAAGDPLDLNEFTSSK